MIHRSLREGVVQIRLDRPPANALELESTMALDHALRAAATQSEAGGVVLTGTGDCFCAGLDLKVVPSYTPDRQREMVLALSSLVRTVYGFPKPLLVALNGHGVAAGTLLALASDYRIGPDDGSRFGLTGVRVGIPYPAAAMSVIEAELAPPARRVALLSARTFDVREARRLGIVDEIVPPRTVLERALEVARDMADMPPDAYRSTKLALRRKALDAIDRVLRDADDPFLESWIPSAGHEPDVERGPL